MSALIDEIVAERYRDYDPHTSPRVHFTKTQFRTALERVASQSADEIARLSAELSAAQVRITNFERGTSDSLKNIISMKNIISNERGPSGRHG